MIEVVPERAFGPRLQPRGKVRFRLWGPATDQVELVLEDGDQERIIAMHARDDGWHEIIAPAGPGSRYSYRIDRGQRVPDPASRFQPNGVHGVSEVVDTSAFDWPDRPAPARPWHEAVIYELHTGTFSREGTFAGALNHLDHLVDLGITAVELMPIAAFPGKRNWGYDGVQLFAPHAGYGRPEDLKALVAAAQARGLLMFLDVVYNHFGPDGNYLHLYAPQFFTERHHTPWGAGINFDGEASGPVRDFFIQNALYWLTQYRFDGLRLDAVHAIADDSEPHILIEIADAVHAGPGRNREVHLVLENDDNAARLLARDAHGRSRWYTAQWNDDFHHALHVLPTGERDGYYQDYTERPIHHLGRCLTEGFAYQGDPSAFRHGACRGEPSAHLPLTAFVGLIQNHDQVGNRALGERISELAPPESLRAALAILLLAPSPPLLFMGQEFMARTPFLFFCDFAEDLAQAVTEGRRREFAGFERFSDPQPRTAIPDPNAPETFERSKLDWSCLQERPHREWLTFHRHLLELRRHEIVPRLQGMPGHASTFEVIGESGLRATWSLGDGSSLCLQANLGPDPLPSEPTPAPTASRAIYADPPSASDRKAWAPWSVVWTLSDKGGGG